MHDQFNGESEMALSKEEVLKIESLTMDLLRDAYRETEIIPPIDLDKVIQHSGLVIKAADFENPDIAGAYDRTSALILIKKSDPYFRQVFTVAHELGHYYLHKEKPDEIFYRGDFENLDGGQKKQEQEANWFASSLLMPQEIFIKFWSILKNINELASSFGVSSVACYYRLKNLGIIPK